ncbi:MAG: hypothetical protein V4451_01665 [Pseudomonadota bacterium]
MSTAASFSRSESIVIHEQWRSTMASDWTDAVVVTRSRNGQFSIFCRKHGDFSERVGDRRWSTVARMKGLRTSAELKSALEDSQQILEITLNWKQTINGLAALDWVAAAALAPLVDTEIPELPKISVLEKQGGIRNSDSVRISVEWGYEVHSLELPIERWLRVCAGKVSYARSRGYYDGTSFWNHWTFRIGQKNSLTVTYGEDGCTGYEGSIDDALLEGPKPNGVDLARLALTRVLRKES